MTSNDSCDLCRRDHDVLTDHCVFEEVHCTEYDAACCAEASADDHPRACCVCGHPVSKR